MAGNNEDRECPLCLESLELDDLNFFPCACGYQICRFCWHRIRTNENGLCPACRKQYSEDPANFKPLTTEELQQIKSKKKQKDLQRKQKITENRKHLANVRVVQKNLVFVVGLPPRLADPEELKKNAYFGKFGKTLKVIVNHTTSYAGSQGPSASAYVTYQRVDDALRAIQAINNSKVEGRTLKASLGTTKYCSNFLKKLQCPKQECMYLHEIGDDAASFTKEDMQAGLHQEYERKLHEQMLANSHQNRKQSSPVNCPNNTLTVSHKEQWPSPKSEQPAALTKSTESSHVQKHKSHPVAGSQKSKCKNTSQENKIGYSTELKSQQVNRNSLCEQVAVDNVHHSVHKSQSSNSKCATFNVSSWQDSLKDMPKRKSPNKLKQKDHRQLQSSTPPFENHISVEHTESGEQRLHNGIPEKPELVNSVQYDRKFPVQQSANVVNGLSHDLPIQRLIQSTSEWSNSSVKDGFRTVQSEVIPNGTTDLSNFVSSHFGKSNPNSFFSNSRNSIGSSSVHTISSFHDGLSQGYPSVFSLTQSTRIPCPPGENSTHVQDDDLGFDPWHESSKGLADLMLKEADEKAKSNGIVFNRSSSHMSRRIPDNILRNSGDFQNYTQRHTVPPPGFTANNYTVNSLHRPTLTEAFPNKMLPVMTAMYNHTSAQISQHLPNAHLQTSVLSNDMLNLQDTDMRPQIYDFQERILDTHQKNVDLNISTHNVSGYVQRVPSSAWGNSALSEVLWQQQQQQHEQAVNQRLCEGKNISPNQVEKMLQQLKLNDIARLQNHIKYNSIAAYRGGKS